jgi:hypothetical protein
MPRQGASSTFFTAAQQGIEAFSGALIDFNTTVCVSRRPYESILEEFPKYVSRRGVMPCVALAGIIAYAAVRRRWFVA